MTKVHDEKEKVDIENAPNLDEHPGAAVLRAGVASIRKDPKAFVMGDWLRRSPDTWCGAVGCFAGHMVMAVEGDNVRTNEELGQYDPATVCTRAIEYAKLTRWEAGSLFYTSGWPNWFFNRYVEATTDQERADILQERVEHFICTRQ